MHIAIFGATSQIAKDLIISFSQKDNCSLSLFGRSVASLEEWINTNNLNGNNRAKEYSEFSVQEKYEVIINFIGAGDPEKVKQMGHSIFEVTEQYDNIVLRYLEQNRGTKYIFLSSGVVYGGNFQEPVDKDTVATIDINNLKSTDWYPIAKLYAEAKHRSLSDLSIVDVRVFNYFSHRQNMNARFFITDVVRAIQNKEMLKTSGDNIIRDFITPPDFYNLIQAIIDYKPINIALDCYTKSPVTKFELLDKIESEFGLIYEFDKDINIINVTGLKTNYYSTIDTAKNIGYTPKKMSLNAVVQEIRSHFSGD